MREEEHGVRYGLKRDQATRSASEPGLHPGTGWAVEAARLPVAPIAVDLQGDRLGRLSKKSGHRDAGVQWRSQREEQESPDQRRLACEHRFPRWNESSLRHPLQTVALATEPTSAYKPTLKIYNSTDLKSLAYLHRRAEKSNVCDISSMKFAVQITPS
jgi:hypothetical protein